MLKNPKLIEKLDGMAGQHWKDAFARFSKVGELHTDRVKVFGL